MKVKYLTGASIATSSAGPGLCRQFGERNVSTIREDQLTAAGLKDVDCLMLPGISGEKSPYPEIIPPEKARMLWQKMEDGMTVILECASFYWGSEEISYLTSDGRKLERQGLGWFKGISRGPSGKGLAPDDNFKYADTTIAEIEYYDGDKTLYTPICISNGPALYLNEEEEINPDVRITSRFIHESGRPVSSIIKTIGNGMLVGMSVLPHIQTMQLGGRFKNPGFESHRVALFNTVAAHENGIQHFENMIYDHIRTHHSKPETMMETFDVRCA